ncbi:MAG: Gfo/Idh/MocA family protein [Thermoguttaceae bacterium]
MSVTRRGFIRRSAAAAAAIGLPAVAPARVLGANEEIRMGVVGLGGRGAGAHVPEFSSQKGVSIVALADPDKARMGPVAARLEKQFGRKVDQYQDMRGMFDRRDIDAVANATMNYWHALSTIWACQQGKHVYVEKPLSHYIWEGRQMVNAARKYKRLVQVGTQYRSVKGYEDLAAWLKAGNLGRILLVTCFANKPRLPIGKRSEPLPIPETVDYDLWCGPAAKVPIYRDRLQYDCSFDWNTGDGESCNQGVHEVDVARWILGYSTLPRRTMSIGGRFFVEDAGNVPNTQIIYYDYPEVPILYEVHNLPKSKEFLTPEDPKKFSANMPRFRGVATGVCVQCEGGYTLGTTAYDQAGKPIRSFPRSENHFANFIKALRSGRQEDLNADVLEGHISTSICHVGNISYRLGKPASVQQQRRQVGDIPYWKEMFERYLAYLADIGQDPNSSTLGPWLEVDAEKECIKDNEEANKIVRGFYRPPYVVPDLSG